MLQENRKYDLKNSFAYSYHNGCTAKKYTLVNSVPAHEGCECASTDVIGAANKLKFRMKLLLLLYPC